MLTAPEGVAAAAEATAAAEAEAGEKAEESSETKKRKKRNIKPLPDALQLLTDKDKDKFTFALEKDPSPKSKMYGHECYCAQTVKLGDGSEFELKKLVLDQLRQLCVNLGIKNIGSSNLFQCRKAIGLLCTCSYALSRPQLVELNKQKEEKISQLVELLKQKDEKISQKDEKNSQLIKLLKQKDEKISQQDIKISAAMAVLAAKSSNTEGGNMDELEEEDQKMPAVAATTTFE